MQFESGQAVQIGIHILVDLDTLTVWRDTTEIALEAKEWGVLRLLIERAGSPVTFDEFCDSVWDGRAAGIENNVRTRISSLRSKLGLAIKNERGLGYLLRTPVGLPAVHAVLQTFTNPALDSQPINAKQSPSSLLNAVANLRPWRVGLMLAIPILIAAAYPIWHFPAQPKRCRLESNTLIAVDGAGSEVWRHEFPNGLQTATYDNWKPAEFCQCADLDGRGQTTVLFNYLAASKDPAFAPGELFAFKRSRWLKSLSIKKFRPGKDVVAGQPGDPPFTPPYLINTYFTMPAAAGRTASVIVSSRHHWDAPNQVSVLDHELNPISEYWHPGHLFLGQAADLKGDGKVQIIMGGVNNGFHAATLVMFDAGSVSGTPTELQDPGFRLVGAGTKDHLVPLPVGTETCTVLIRRSDIARDKRKPQPFNRVVNLVVTKELIEVTVAESQSPSAFEQIVYRFDHSWNLVSIVPLISFYHKHQELESEGVLDHAFTMDELHPLITKKGCLQ